MIVNLLIGLSICRLTIELIIFRVEALATGSMCPASRVPRLAGSAIGNRQSAIRNPQSAIVNLNQQSEISIPIPQPQNPQSPIRSLQCRGGLQVMSSGPITGLHDLVFRAARGTSALRNQAADRRARLRTGDHVPGRAAGSRTVRRPSGGDPAVHQARARADRRWMGATSCRASTTWTSASLS